MPSPSLDEFWTLLDKSRLVDAGAVETLRREHAAASAGAAATAAKDVAAWLVRRGLITRWQGKRLAIGNLGPFFIGDYRLLERHDREGDAFLFTARHEPSGRIVSLVLLNAKQCRRIDVWTEIVQRTTAASQVTDPMLSRTWSLEQHESSRIIVSEHVEGTSLAAELDQHGPLPAVQAGVLVSQIARAVADLHAQGSIHGSVSTGVLLREPPPGGVPRTGRVRLLQFPLVGDPHRIPLRPWNTDDERDQLGRSACFVAPELMLPNAVCDPRSDVYSIGAVLYALLAGKPPCWEGDARQTLRRAAFGDGPSPLGPPAVTDELATLVGYLMARDPAERYQTAAEAADAIAACLGLAGRAGTAAVQAPAFPEADLPAVTAGPTPTGGDVVPDFAGVGGAAPLVNVGSTTAGGRASGSAGGPSRPARRGGQQLRLLGGAVTLGILAATAALIWSKLDTGRRRPPGEVALAPASGSGAGPQSPRPTAPESPTTPKPGGVEGWGVPEPKEGSGEAMTDLPGQATEIPEPQGAPAQATRQIVIDDAPGLLWASPTEGPRPRLEYLLPGSQLILLARPAALTADPDGALFVRSLGPAAAAGLEQLAAWCGCKAGDIEFVQAGWQAGGTEGDVLGGYAIRLVEGRTLPTDEAARRRAWGATTAVEVAGERVFKGEPFSFWVPAAEAGRVLVVAAEAPAAAMLPGAGGPNGPADTLVAQLVRQAAAAGDRKDGLQAELPRELEELVTLLDADRHLTLLGSPHYLLTQGRVVLAGPLAKLAEPIEGLFGDAVKAAAVSAHFSDDFYLELDAIATLDVPAKDMAPELATRVESLADTVELYCAALNPVPYGRVLVLRLPSMLRTMVATMRSGAEGKGAILNAYLPRPAGHNLALAAELALAQTPGAAAAVAAAVPAPPVATDALGRLEQKITLVFAKDTLEKSIQMISDEINVPMEIIGPDLQLEGITKNQSFGLDARDKPAREILLEIMAKANPDGKLVYVVTKAGGEETIFVTTRAAVAKRGDTLPPGLEAAPVVEKKKP